MFKLCVFVALLSLVAAAPAPAPVPAPAPGLIGPAVIASPWGAPLVAGPILAGPRIVSVVPAPVSHVAISQVHPAPVVVKHLW
ncbi:neuropeptide-like 3 [Drosophila nasuta]|uniref:Neuropeptide-like 3 n=1 Tax=Drosophila albomicans TaxID=7291 RepID=A0A6P8WXF4_DROAB|nr:neuropeptide-like 3 [Drosophila albomicans]XP_060654995.1 neuropeptide-like 3 [Drosophila nasuta]